MNIHPIKDLNLNPYEVAFYLKQIYPNKTDEEYETMGKPWSLTSSHFGIRGTYE